MIGDKRRKVTLILMGLWICLLGSLAYWFEVETRKHERQRALSTTRGFFQQVLVSRQWNAMHGGVYVPITEKTQPNPHLPQRNRDLSTEQGLKLTKINPSYMTRQIAEIAQKSPSGIQFHLTSLRPIRPENGPAEWEARWLRSFEQGSKEQGEFVENGDIIWFRYMAPLVTEAECLPCHAEHGYKTGEIRGGLSVSVPYPRHDHFQLILAYGVAGGFGLLLIFFGGRQFEQRQRLFDATFNSPMPTSVTDNNFTILLANQAYWEEFGPLPAGRKSIRCHEHRPGKSCHTDECPLVRIMNGGAEYSYEALKEFDGEQRYFIITAKPLLDRGGRIIGCVETYQDITARKRAEEELEEFNRRLESLSNTDGLTGIANRRHFDEVLGREYDRHVRSEKRLSLILLDIDRFKRFNDFYGHPEGDRCLQRVARVMADCAKRPADLVARYGGEEFACILPETERSGAIAVARKIQQAIIDCAIPHQESGVAPHVTASLGVATMQCKMGKSVKDLIAQADALLYRAKNAGRNRVEALAPEEVGEEVKGDLVRLVWKDYYCSGHPLIDGQHQTLFEIANDLFDAILSSSPALEVTEIVGRLFDEISQHFQDEERILHEVGFPDVQQHAGEHAKLLESGNEMFQKFKAATLTTGDVFQFLAFEVVMQHMVSSDRQFFPFLQKVAAEREEASGPA